MLLRKQEKEKRRFINYSEIENSIEKINFFTLFRFWVEKRTRGSSGVPPAKPDFMHWIVETNMFATVRVQWLPCGGEDYDCREKTIGSHFYVKYK